MSHSRFIRVLFVLVLGLTVFAATTPQQADAASRRIVVSLSRQRIYAYQGNTLVYSAAVNARGTARGSFRIQNKITLTTSIIRGWFLPYWMGIYYIRGVQNGIHGPEVLRGGGFATNSLGCVVIRSRADAAWFFRWTPVGTPVTVRW